MTRKSLSCALPADIASGLRHVALLHAICACASLFTPIITDKPADTEVTLGAAAFLHSGRIFRLGGNEPGPRFIPKGMDNFSIVKDSSFGASQLRWCSIALRTAAQRADRLLQLMQGERIITSTVSVANSALLFSCSGCVLGVC